MTETGKNLTVELAAVCIAIAAGFVHMLEAWPSPWVPVAWMGGVLVLFGGYRVGMFVRHKFFPAPEPEESDQEQARAAAGRGDGPSLKWSAVKPNVPTEPDDPGPLKIPGAGGDFAGSEMATMGIPQVALGEGSEDPTGYLDAQELRPERDEDFDEGPKTAIPMFAESTMSIDERTLALKAVEVDGEAETSSEGPTAPMDRVDDGQEATMAMDSVDSGDDATLAMDPVDSGDADKTEAMDEAQFRGAQDAGGGAKTQKTPAVRSPRKPFADKAEPPRAQPEKSSQDRAASSEPIEPPSETDGVQMFDADKLAEMKRRLDQEQGDE